MISGKRKKRIFKRFKLTFCVFLLLISTFTFAIGAESENVVKFGIVSFYNPRLMVMRYQPLLDALEKRTPYTFKLILTKSYSETVEKLENGEIDVAYLGPVTFIRALHRFNAEPLVRLNTNNSDVFYSVIAVRDDSDINNLNDLEGKDFAFGSPLSTSSHLYPRMMLKRDKIIPDKINSVHYYKHHDSAARAVMTGEADACGIRDVVAERYEKRGLRVIAKSRPIPNFPLVVKTSMDYEKKSILKKAFLSFHPDVEPDISEMKSWDKEIKSGFSDVSISDYDEVKIFMERTFGENAYSGDPTLHLDNQVTR